ncbi:MAG: PD40 domain-containing protein, partial [Anaerolineae bacterium]|nr:PD40 domain-containing protein [Anaerolineae bacterium]
EVGKPGFYLNMSASPDGQHIAYTFNAYEPVRLWSSEDSVSHTLFDIFVSLGIALVFSPDGKYLAYQGGVLDVAARDVRFTMNNIGNLVFSPDGERLAVVTSKQVYLYDVQTGAVVARTPRVARSNHDNLLTAKFSPDRATLVTTSSGGIMVYDADTGDALYSFQMASRLQGWVMENIVFSPDGRTLAFVDPQGILQVWDTRTGTSHGVFATNGAKGIAFSPDGQLLAIGNPLRLIDLRSGEIMTVSGNYGGSRIVFSPDGSSLMVDSTDNFFADLQSVMVLGIPTPERAVWQPITAQVTASAINVRTEPDGSAPTVAVVSGEVLIRGRNTSGEALYLDAPAGWVWSAPEYIDVGTISLDTLPVIASAPVPTS